MVTRQNFVWAEKALIAVVIVLLFAGFAMSLKQRISVDFNATVEDTGTVYNISISSSDGVEGNITEINITLPAGFTLLDASNTTGTAGTANFTNSSASQLSWAATDNGDGLMNGTGNGSITFNATAANPGTFNFTIIITNRTDANASAGTSSYYNMSITVNDTTVPLVQDANITNPVQGANLTGTVTLNVSVSDNGVLQTVFFNLTNTTGSWNDTRSASNPSAALWNGTLNTSLFPDGTYNLTVFANDTGGNLNATARILVVRFDNTVPTATASCSPTTVNTGDAFPCSCSGSDATSGINTTTSSSNAPEGKGIPQSTGTYTYTCSVTDHVNLGGSSTATYTVNLASTGSPGGSSSSGGSSTTTPKVTEVEWVTTIEEAETELSARGSVSASLGGSQRVSVLVSGGIHTVGVVSLTSTSATVQVASSPREVTLNIGDSEKFELDDDDFYDVLVTLNSITNNKADLSIDYIHEEVPQEDTSVDTGTGDIVSGSEGRSKGTTILIIVLILIVIGVVVFFVWKKNQR
jgi:hypothetical protein